MNIRKKLVSSISFISISIRLNRAQNLEAVDARQLYPKEYTSWREDPSNFEVNGVYPVRKLWGTAREAWREILSSPVISFHGWSCLCFLYTFQIDLFDKFLSQFQGENLLVVTHKSILRALICTALGLGPER